MTLHGYTLYTVYIRHMWCLTSEQPNKWVLQPELGARITASCRFTYATRVFFYFFHASSPFCVTRRIFSNMSKQFYTASQILNFWQLYSTFQRCGQHSTLLLAANIHPFHPPSWRSSSHHPTPHQWHFKRRGETGRAGHPRHDSR